MSFVVDSYSPFVCVLSTGNCTYNFIDNNDNKALIVKTIGMCAGCPKNQWQEVIVIHNGGSAKLGSVNQPLRPTASINGGTGEMIVPGSRIHLLVGSGPVYVVGQVVTRTRRSDGQQHVKEKKTVSVPVKLANILKKQEDAYALPCDHVASQLDKSPVYNVPIDYADILPSLPKKNNKDMIQKREKSKSSACLLYDVPRDAVRVSVDKCMFYSSDDVYSLPHDCLVANKPVTVSQCTNVDLVQDTDMFGTKRRLRDHDIHPVDSDSCAVSREHNYSQKVSKDLSLVIHKGVIAKEKRNDRVLYSVESEYSLPKRRFFSMCEIPKPSFPSCDDVVVGKPQQAKISSLETEPVYQNVQCTTEPVYQNLQCTRTQWQSSPVLSSLPVPTSPREHVYANVINDRGINSRSHWSRKAFKTSRPLMTSTPVLPRSHSGPLPPIVKFSNFVLCVNDSSAVLKRCYNNGCSVTTKDLIYSVSDDDEEN